MEWGDMDWIDLAQDRDQRRALVNTVLNLRVPYNVGKFLSSCTTEGFSRRAHLHGVSYIYTDYDSGSIDIICCRIHHRFYNVEKIPQL
jgi:hypothetical protein